MKSIFFGLIFALSLNAGWRDYFTLSPLNTFRTTISAKYVMYGQPFFSKISDKLAALTPKQWGILSGLSLTTFAAYLGKKKINRYNKERSRNEFAKIADTLIKGEQHYALVSNLESTEEINPNYFTANKQGNLFKLSEVSFLLKELEEKKQHFQPQQMSDKKERTMEDIRELPEKGTFAENPAMNKYFISFKGLLNATGKKILRISLLERIPGTKKKIDRTTNEMTNVPVVKKLAKTIIVGTETDPNTFVWQKITNSSIDVNTEIEKESKVKFNDSRTEKFEIGTDKYHDHEIFFEKNPTNDYLMVMGNRED